MSVNFSRGDIDWSEVSVKIAAGLITEVICDLTTVVVSAFEVLCTGIVRIF